MGEGSTWDLSAPSSELCCEPKTDLRNQRLYKEKKIESISLRGSRAHSGMWIALSSTPL